MAADRLKPRTSSLSGLMPNRASAWPRSRTSALRPNSELLTTRSTLAASAGSFSMQLFSARRSTCGSAVSSSTRTATAGKLYSSPARLAKRSSAPSSVTANTPNGKKAEPVQPHVGHGQSRRKAIPARSVPSRLDGRQGRLGKSSSETCFCPGIGLPLPDAFRPCHSRRRPPTSHRWWRRTRLHGLARICGRRAAGRASAQNQLRFSTT